MRRPVFEIETTEDFVGFLFARKEAKEMPFGPIFVEKTNGKNLFTALIRCNETFGEVRLLLDTKAAAEECIKECVAHFGGVVRGRCGMKD